MAGLALTSISSPTNRILVKATLQVKDGLNESDSITNIYTLGDVTETGGPRMARAGITQAEIMCGNIMAQIEG